MLLPRYDPPDARRACVAVGFGPLLILLGFTLLVARVIEPDTTFALFLACVVWVLWEMHDFQRATDRYNAEYAERHLRWRSSEALLALVAAEGMHEPTREFVLRFVEGGRVVRADGQLA
jgi:hypothetical protein